MPPDLAIVPVAWGGVSHVWTRACVPVRSDLAPGTGKYAVQA